MSKNEDLHGNAPDKSKVVLLIIDMISDFDFEDGEKLYANTKPAAERVAELKKKAKKTGVPVVYVNDNFGKWQSDFKKLLTHCADENSRGSSIARLLAPDDDDYFVLKPKHSGFFSTTLDVLLEYLGAETLILTGVATDICILFTANDAYMRDFSLIVPRDCVAANENEQNESTLKFLEKNLKADTRSSTEINFEKLKASAGN
ncbi:MAG TPA: isochorismatase family cysteine hydrolase [Pyrinomonadaceae bacterium]|jgi:nicotinamidase-related amidase